MEWGMLLAIVGFAALVQLAFFWYYLRLGQRNESVYPQATSESGDPTVSNHQSGSRNRGGAGADTPILTCQECGYDNTWNPVFTYCGNCVEKLN